MKIRNKKTGEVKEINPEEASKYGVASTGQKVYRAATAVPRFMFPQATKYVEGAVGASSESLKSLLGGDIQGAKEAAESYKPNLLGPLGNEASRGAAVEGLSSIALNKLIGTIGNKIIPKNVRKIKLNTPTKTQQSARVVKEELWKEVTNLLEQPSGQKQVINTKQVLSSLDDVTKDLHKTKNIVMLDKVDKLADRVASLGDTITPEQAILLSREFKDAKKLFNVTTGDLTLALGQDTTKRAALRLSKELSSQAKNAVPGLTEAMGNYGQVAGLSKNLAKPWKNWWMGGLGGMLAGSIGGPGSGAAVGAAGALGAMPYSNFAIRKLLYPALQAGRIPATAGLNQLLGGGE